MDVMKGMEEFADMVDDNFAKMKGPHHHHASGMPRDGKIEEIRTQCNRDLNAADSYDEEAYKQMDLAWVSCLHKAGIIDRKTASIVLKAVLKGGKETKGVGREKIVTETLGGDEDLGSVINIGRTQIEPMSRIQMRDKWLDSFESFMELLETVLSQSEKNIDTIMPGHTHLSQAQPITLAHYLLSVFEGLARGIEQLELAYKYINRNSGGCGACSGIAWPVDRWYLTKLLGFDDLVEPTYDSESAQDHSLMLTFALTNIEVLVSKIAMDLEIWSTEEVDMTRVHPSWCGVSSFMPQKSHPGGLLEWTRISASDCIGEMMRSVVMCKGEPHEDVLPMVKLPSLALRSLAYARSSVGFLNGHLKNIYPQKEKMLRYVREGFSCATEIVVHMVKNLNFGGRRAHRIVATFVRMAREKGLNAQETTGQLLDEAARYLEEREPKIKTETLHKLLDPEEFIQSHNNVGGTAPAEVKRLIDERKKTVADMRNRQEQRKKRIEDSMNLLKKETDNIIGE
jgi:argininosuccinate lyase